MPLSAPSVSREPLHDRSIRARSFLRDDGLIDIEAELLDIKGYDFQKRGGVHPAGKPVHHMWLRVTINGNLDIVDAEAVFDAAPFGENCSEIDVQYRDLVGMNLMRGFRHQVRERFGRTQGCTHVSELATVLPTVAIQSMARQRLNARAADPNIRPFPIDGCHAQRNDGPVVKEFYPRWYGVPKGGLPHPEPDASDSNPGSATSSSTSSDS